MTSRAERGAGSAGRRITDQSAVTAAQRPAYFEDAQRQADTVR